MGLTPEFLARINDRRTALRAELAALLPQKQAIVWEIGSGHGHFLTRYAQEFPEKTCVGVDINTLRIGRSRKKATRGKLANCHFVLTEAGEFLHALPDEITFSEIWVLFPDPWPKKRHHKNRIMRADFLESAASRVKEGGKLYFRTDHADYFAAVKNLMPTVNTWAIAENADWPLEHETVFQARAPSYQSFVAIRTSHPATPTETTDSRLPPLTGPR
ncbi:tRNA (guanosine(46)-N7)-methyltransferase TrmB [Oleiharenicola lentus]|uniref:tRNA (guanosine(46)-N7)-methyltransferase TrmB n=1 Tax=Oleiharenicola lentus TaxID=2508720 RepID=UPI003F66C534